MRLIFASLISSRFCEETNSIRVSDMKRSKPAFQDALSTENGSLILSVDALPQEARTGHIQYAR